MRLPSDLLQRPVDEGARLLALDFLSEAHGAVPRVKDAKDNEGLHAFRVGLRRLRSVLRAYGPWLKSSVGKKTARALKHVAHATNAGRDAEVLVAWLQKQTRSFKARERKAIEALLHSLTEQRDAAYARIEGSVVSHFVTATDGLGNALQSYQVMYRVNEPRTTPTLAEALSLVLTLQIDAFESKLVRIETVSDEKAAHQTRIAAKRIRYLLEPLGARAPNAMPLVEQLKKLQDVLGELHDMHVLARVIDDGRLPRGGRDALAAHVDAHMKTLFAQLKSQYLNTRARDLIRDLRILVDALRVTEKSSHVAHAPRSDAPVEIERKFLLKSMPARAKRAKVKQIDQGYLPGEKLIERVRRVREGKRETYFRTVKVGAGVTRIELEEQTSKEIFSALWKLTKGRRVQKKRYVIKEGALTWEIDDFSDRKLVLAEVELQSEDQAVALPKWLGEYVVRDVTGESTYVNAKLAK